MINGLTVYIAHKYDVKRAKIEIHGNVIKQVSDFICLGNVVLEVKRDTGVKLQKYNKINSIIKKHIDTNVN
jgi:hypothetical protein